MKRVWLWWSSGKDSAWALHELRANRELEVTGLVTTVNSEFGRVAMHGVREELVRQQATVAGLPLHVLPIPYPCPNERWERGVEELTEKAREQGIGHMAFGDLFLEDVRAYRERVFTSLGIKPLFPLWSMDTGELAGDMIDAGLRAYITCVDPKRLSAEFAGRAFDNEFLRDLPPDVDPCGENGEFHSFAHQGPMFSEPVGVNVGERVKRDGFVFCDLIPTATSERGGPDHDDQSQPG